MEQLLSLGLSPEEADRALRRAHAWGVQSYWRKSKTNETPQPELMQERLAWLRERVAGEGGPEEAEAALRKLVQAFPEALGLDVQTVLAPSVALLAKSYGIAAPATLAGVLARKPTVLGNTVDCSGDCVGECNRCWARF